jgi:hypothetical protein
MTSLSPTIDRAAPRARFAGSALLALLLVLVVVAAVVIAINAAATGVGGSDAGYDAPFHSQYLQEISASW